MSRYVIYQASWDDEHDWNKRKLAHTQAITNILAENWVPTQKPLPKPGDRPLEFLQVPSMYDPERHGWSTHYKLSDWEVYHVVRYTVQSDELTEDDYEEVVICVCRYAPIDAPLMSMPDRTPLPDEIPDEPSVEPIANPGA